MPAARPDIVLITIDTLRADRVGITGGPGDLTPAIDALGRDGAAFTDATAHAPLTLPSHASILTGLYPASHGVHDNTGFALAAPVPTLATLLRARGYHTAAFVSSFVLRGATGLSRGFDTYDDRFEGAGRTHLTTTSLERRAAAVARTARDWLSRAQRPFFLWVHFYDPHAPYDPPPAFAAKLPGRPYDGEVAAADFGVSTILGALRAASRRETIVVVTGDHGEGLGDHGESEHGMLLYDSTLHVPLVMQGPGVPAGVTVRRQVRHVDLLPTIAELAGVAPPDKIDGVSLVPLLRGGGHAPVSEAPASYAESEFGALHFGWQPLRSLRDGEWKYIDGGAPELYHLADDRGERNDVTSARSDTAAGMARALGTLARADGQSFVPDHARLKGSRSDEPAPRSGEPAPRSAEPDPAAAERLRSLGYVTGRVELGGEGGDPRRRIAQYEAYVKAFNVALAALETGEVGAGENGFRRLAAAFPLASEPHQYLARALAARHATAGALAELDVAIRLRPQDSAAYFDAARLLADQRQFDRAFARIADGRRLEPSSFYGALTEGLVARAAGQADRAERAFREAIQMNPTLAVAHLELGQLAESRGDRAAARREFQLALDGDSTLDAARRALDRVRR